MRKAERDALRQISDIMQWLTPDEQLFVLGYLYGYITDTVGLDRLAQAWRKRKGGDCADVGP